MSAIALRQLTAAEEAIDLVKLDRALATAKDDLDQAIHQEMLRVANHWLETGFRPVMQLTTDMTDVIAGLQELGRQEAWRELDRLGYDVSGRRYIDESGPGRDRDVPGFLVRMLRWIEVRLDHELVVADLSGLAQNAVATAVMEMPGARDIASRAISTALMNGFGTTWDQSHDLVTGWAYTAIMDGGTCEECEPLDGEEYPSWDAIQEVLPGGGPNPFCLGGGRCRCRAVPLPADA